MKKIKKIFILFTMLVAGLSFKCANNVEKNVVAGAADVVTDANKPAPESYAYLTSSWDYTIVKALSEQGVTSEDLFKTILITNDREKLPKDRECLSGCPVEVGIKGVINGVDYTPTNYTDGCAVAAYVYPNATDATTYDCVLYAFVNTIYSTYGKSVFGYMDNVEKITFDCNFSLANSQDHSAMRMFAQDYKLVQIEGLDKWDTSNVTDMSSMFVHCHSLTTLDVSSFDTSMVTNMNSMFSSCEMLTSIKGLENFNTSQVTTMNLMFGNCNKLETVDVSSFNTSEVLNMANMFSQCNALTSIKGLDSGKFITSKVTRMDSMFSGCYKLTTLDVSGFDTSNVTDMCQMFASCSKLTTIDLSGFNTSNVTNMQSMFNGCSGLTALDVSNFNTSKVTNMSYMFRSCSGLTNIQGLDSKNWDTSNVTTMQNMFTYCSKLTTIDLSGFNTSNVTNMKAMFSNCSGLTALDVSNLNTSKVKDMSEMFQSCSTLTTIQGFDSENWDTSNVTNMKSMFKECKKLKTLDVSGFNTSKVTDMSQMFSTCYRLTTLDLSGFDTSKVTNMSEMFAWCEGLTTIKGLENFDTSNVTNMDKMFSNCMNLTSLDLSNFDMSSVETMYRFMFRTFALTEIKAPKNLGNNTIELTSEFGMTEIDSSMEGWTLLQGSKEFNILYNTLLKINVCTEYAKASELQALYDGLIDKEKAKLATLADDGGVILTDKLSYMVGYADYKANEATATTSETHLVLSAKTSQYLVIVIACLSLSLIGGYYFIQKKKYAK